MRIISNYLEETWNKIQDFSKLAKYINSFLLSIEKFYFKLWNLSEISPELFENLRSIEPKIFLEKGSDKITISAVSAILTKAQTDASKNDK